VRSIAGEQVCAFDRLYTLGPDVLSHLRNQPFARANLLTRCASVPYIRPPLTTPLLGRLERAEPHHIYVVRLWG
jgi:hypothetical protein